MSPHHVQGRLEPQQHHMIKLRKMKHNSTVEITIKVFLITPDHVWGFSKPPEQQFLFTWKDFYIRHLNFVLPRVAMQCRLCVGVSQANNRITNLSTYLWCYNLFVANTPSTSSYEFVRFLEAYWHEQRDRNCSKRSKCMSKCHVVCGLSLCMLHSYSRLWPGLYTYFWGCWRTANCPTGGSEGCYILILMFYKYKYIHIYTVYVCICVSSKP